jgi:SAM-dependent methyltransferase
MSHDHTSPEPPADESGRVHAGHHEQAGHGPLDWDQRYSSAEQMWSGDPNGALVAEVADLEPGTALDVGCGEGADAIWLAGRGWTVTAIDVSEVALQRARAAADLNGVEMEWLRTGLVDADLAAGGYDLVSAQYPALLRTATHDAERSLLAAVAPGGHLIVVHHADIDAEVARSHGFDPDDFVASADVASLLDDSWTVIVDERRPRHLDSGAGAGHSHDLVLHAVRAR